MENWQEHTNRYLDRTVRLREPLARLGKALQPLPPAPLDFELSARGRIHYQLCIAVIGGVRSADELCSSIEALWISGRFLTISLSVRLLIEMWGAVEFARREIMEKLEQTNDLEAAQRKISRFLLGANSDVPLPWGGVSGKNLVHVMEMVRQAEVASPGTKANYDFLCDASHPCYLQHTYLMLAGSKHDNWSNSMFAAYGHQMLDRTLKAAEDATKGIAEAGIVIIDASMPVILADRERLDQ